VQLFSYSPKSQQNRQSLRKINALLLRLYIACQQFFIFFAFFGFTTKAAWYKVSQSKQVVALLGRRQKQQH
jgi:hypothetical protein